MKRHLRSAVILAAAFLSGPGQAFAQVPDSAFAVSRGGQSIFRVNVDGGTLFGGSYDGGINSGGIPAEGAGTRFFWYPQKASVRAGTINGTQWDDANIGYFSVAFGQDVRASGDNGAAFGVRSTAAGQSTFAVGEDITASGAASVAMGYHAHTNARQGSFVFGDRSTVDTIRAGVNHSANWRVSGGFRIFTSSNLSTGVTVQSGIAVSNWGQANAVISTSTGAMLGTNGVWTNASDVNRKRDFLPADGAEVLRRLRGLPIQTWTYNVEEDGVRHLGPMAQDFKAAFGLGDDDRMIGTVDADGVALLGVQTLDRRTEGQQARIETLERDNAALRAELEGVRRGAADTNARLARLEALLAELATKPPQR